MSAQTPTRTSPDITFTQDVFDDFQPNADFDGFQDHSDDHFDMESAEFPIGYGAFQFNGGIPDVSMLQQDGSLNLGVPYPVGTSAFTLSDDLYSTTVGDPVWQGSKMYPHNYPIPAPSSGQTRIAVHRSLKPQFGQVTPPDEASPGSSMQEAIETRDAANDKSERARNAANMRHAKKNARKDSGAITITNADENENDPELEDKREKYREKNRLAAAKCRAKKKENTDLQESDHRVLSERNAMLKHLEQELRYELSQWRTKALQHVNCPCNEIQQYNKKQADMWSMNMGMSLGSFSVGGIFGPSPTDSGAPDSTAPTPDFDYTSGTRTQSMPELQSSPPAILMRPHSFAAQSNYAFAPVTTSSDPAARMDLEEDLEQQFSGYLQHSASNQGPF